MVSAILSRFVILTVGTLYPAYRSYKGVKTKNVREYVRWMMYWIIFALFLCAEAFADIFVAFWCPLYYELKIAVVLWLISPYTKGASLLYRKFVHPFLMKHEKEIDLYLDKLKRESYTRVVRLGNRGISYAKEAVATAALRSHEHIIGQLRKTTSLNDVNNDSQSENVQFSPEDEIDFGMVIRRRPRKQRPALAQAKGAASRMTQSVSGDFVKNSHVTTTNQEHGTTEDAEMTDEQNFYGEEQASSLVEHEFGYLEEEDEEVAEDQNQEEDGDEKGEDDGDDEDYEPNGTLRQRVLVKRSAKLQQQRKTVDDMDQNKKTAKHSPSDNAYATLPRRSQRKTVKKQ